MSNLTGRLFIRVPIICPLLLEAMSLVLPIYTAYGLEESLVVLGIGIISSFYLRSGNYNVGWKGLTFLSITFLIIDILVHKFNSSGNYGRLPLIKRTIKGESVETKRGRFVVFGVNLISIILTVFSYITIQPYSRQDIGNGEGLEGIRNRTFISFVAKMIGNPVSFASHLLVCFLPLTEFVSRSIEWSRFAKYRRILKELETNRSKDDSAELEIDVVSSISESDPFDGVDAGDFQKVPQFVISIMNTARKTALSPRLLAVLVGILCVRH